MAGNTEYNFYIIKSRAIQPYHWHCKSANGQIKYHSENYSRKGTCLNSIKVLVKDLRVGCKFKVNDITGEKIGPNSGLRYRKVR